MEANCLYVVEVKDGELWRIMKGTNHFHIFTTLAQCRKFLNRTWKSEAWWTNPNVRVMAYHAEVEDKLDWQDIEQ